MAALHEVYWHAAACSPTGPPVVVPPRPRGRGMRLMTSCQAQRRTAVPPARSRITRRACLVTRTADASHQSIVFTWLSQQLLCTLLALQSLRRRSCGVGKPQRAEVHYRSNVGSRDRLRQCPSRTVSSSRFDIREQHLEIRELALIFSCFESLATNKRQDRQGNYLTVPWKATVRVSDLRTTASRT